MTPLCTRHWLEHLAYEFAGYAPAVEFRHRSWAHADVPEWLAEKKLDLVAVDAPALPNLYPSGLVQSGPHVYVRFHSRKSQNWYLSDKDRYDYDYDENALTQWMHALQRNEATTERVSLLFNNCHRGQAAQNAQRIAQLLARMAPTMEIVSAFRRQRLNRNNERFSSSHQKVEQFHGSI